MTLKKDSISKKKAGLKKAKEPRLVGSIVSEMLQGWHSNTDLGCEVKTILRSDVRMKTGKEYRGILRRDSDAEIEEFRCHDPHYTFVESTALSTTERRNVRLYDGRHISCTKRLNGTARLNFKNLKQDAYHNVDNYAFEVANEIREALKGFVGE